MNKQLYQRTTPISQEDYYDLSEEYKIPYETLEKILTSLMTEKEIQLGAYTGGMRVRIEAMLEDVSTQPKEEDEINEPMKTPIANLAEEIASSVDEPEDEIVSPAPLSEYDDVAEYASLSLIATVANEDGHFDIDERGICTINKDNLPDIQKSYGVVSNILNLKELGGRIDEKTSWMLGSIVAALEEFHGEEFSISQVCNADTPSYNTVATACGVFKAFKDEKYNLPFSHHKEAHYAKVEDKTKKLVLKKAEEYELSSKDVRALCSISKKMDDDQTIKNIKSTEQAKDLIAAYKDARNIFYIYRAGEWMWQSGHKGVIPEGDVVIDTKDRKAYARGLVVDIKKYTPPEA
jgi:hypothetical protein